MARVHPNAPGIAEVKNPSSTPVALTVWRKSLLFSCSGFTVFDAAGDLVFRVDNYAAGVRGEVVLMDASGSPLLTIRRKKLSLGDQWLVYRGEESINPLFSVKKHVSLLASKNLAHVTAAKSCRFSSAGAYEIEGSYARRSVVVYDQARCRLAEIKQKEASKGVGFGTDVFCLVIQPELDSTVAMAMVILLDRMFGSKVSMIKG